MFSVRCCICQNFYKLSIVEAATTSLASISSFGQQRLLAPKIKHFEKRHLSTEPPIVIKTIFQYGSDAYITQGLQAGLEGIFLTYFKEL